MREAIASQTVVRQGAQRLRAAGMEHARSEAEWLLARLMDMRPLELYLDARPVPQDTAARFFAHIESRAGGVPLQYLLGEAEFFGRRFTVTPGVFIPRPETESVLAAGLEAMRLLVAARQRPLRLLDVGTGSGCLAVTLARELPTCVVTAVEVSWTVLCVARQNAEWHGVAARVHFVHGQWVEAIRGRFDALVSNPPYVPSLQVDHLPLDVRQEPRLSLDGGVDGLRDLVQLIDEAPRVLAPGGLCVLECGEDQVERLLQMVAARSWVGCVERLRDLAQRPRGLLVTHRGCSDSA